MVSLEVINTVAYENLRPARPYGLVDPKDIDLFRIPPIGDEELFALDNQFDELCANTGQGYGEYSENHEPHTVRYDVRHEVGDTWVRSISKFKGFDESGNQSWDCISRIDNYTEDVHLLTRHGFMVDSEGFISEPTVGSPDIKPGSYNDLLSYFRAVEEATPVAQVLSRIA